MKILFFLAVLANLVVFMWEYKYGAFERSINASRQLGKEPILLVNEVKVNQLDLKEKILDVDFTSLYPPGLDPRADNLVTEQFVLEDFTGELLSSAEPPSERP